MIGYISLSILAIALAGLCIFLGINRKKLNRDIEDKNYQLEERYKKIKENLIRQEEEMKHLETVKSGLMADINNSQEVSYSAFTRYQNSLEESYKMAEEEYDKLTKKLENLYNNCQDSLKKDVEQKEIEYKQELNNIKQELNKLKETRAAAIEAQRREELMKLEKDSYRVILTPSELTTIEMINEIKPRLPEPRILCMLIWQTFYQKKLTVLCKKILGNSPVCGIYKITNIKNNMCYIGQAKNIDDRWKEHMKYGLGIDTPVGNKLYQAMKEIGPENFTFELLEACPVEQLDEKEKFYIELYQAKDYGYNSTNGVNKQKCQ
jgi:uncharacterized protein YoxC